MSSCVRRSLGVLALATACAGTARADWPTDPAVNVPVATTAVRKLYIGVVSDGAGGTVSCWLQGDAPPLQVCAQRLDAGGVARWPAAGVALGSTSISADGPRIIADGAGRAIVAWCDTSGGGAIVAQRLDAAGMPQWVSGGVTLAAAANPSGLALVPDGAGGAVAVWSRDRQYAQRVNAAGLPQWPSAQGVPLTARTTSSWEVQGVPDGTGGMIATWGEMSAHAYAQRIDGTGTTRWGTNGLELDPVDGAYRQQIAADGTGGAIVSWLAGYSTARAQRFDASGAPVWPASVLLAPDAYGQFADTLVSDGEGGAFAAWLGRRHLASSYQFFAQHLDATGAPLWTSVGVALDTTGVGYGTPIALSADGVGGLLALYPVQTGGSGPYHLRAQSLLPSGAPRWGAHGAPISTAAGSQDVGPDYGGGLVPDGSGGLTAVWWDSRSNVQGDVYAQHVGVDGSPGNTGVPPGVQPRALALAAPWPCPARARAAVTFAMAQPAAGRVRLTVLDVGGRTVRTLADGTHAAGTWIERWDGRDAAGRAVAAGLYFVRFESAGAGATRKLVLTP